MNGDGAGERYIGWLKRVRHSGEYSNVIVRVGPEEFNLHLFPLLSESTYFQEHVNADPPPNQKPKLVVDLLDFPGGPEIFHVVVDHWYGSMEHEISTSNVAKVICASDFLGVESLKRRAFKFLDENVFNCWKSCLAVLATYSCEEDPEDLVGDELFDRCKDAFLDKIKTTNSLNSPDYAESSSMFCNVTNLLTVAALLPAKMAEHIFDCIRSEVPGLIYRVDDNTTPSAVLLCNGEYKEEFEFDAGSISWVEELPELLPDLVKRAMFLTGLCESMIQVFFWSTACSINFLCSLLVKTVEAGEAMASKNMPRGRLDVAVRASTILVGMYMGRLHSSVVQKCNFATITSIVKNVRRPEDRTGIPIDEAAKVLDNCLLAHLNRGSLSVAQVLVIYQNFGYRTLSSHAGLYNVFKDALQNKTMSSEQRKELQQMLDFKKLPDKWVRRIFQELELDHEPRLLKRVLQIHEKHAKRIKIPNVSFSLGKKNTDKACRSFLRESLVVMKHFKVFMTAAEQVEEANNKGKLSCNLELQQQVVQLTALRNEKLKLEGELQVKNGELFTMRDEKLRLESELGVETANVAALTMRLRSKTTELSACQRELEEEKEERLCLICFERPRDAQCLPCKHFLYCCTCLNQHIKQSGTCPMCRTPCGGVNLISAGVS